MYELKIMNYVLHRKFSKRLREKDLKLSNEAMLVHLKKLITSKVHKRPEECYKFIFNRTIKHL